MLHVTSALFLWSWFDVPVDPRGESGLAAPFVVLFVASVPLALVFAALGARFAERTSLTRAVAWAGALVYGIWLGAWTSLVGTSGGSLECNPPGCRSSWGPRALTFATATAVAFVCAWIEAALRKRWSSAPS